RTPSTAPARALSPPRNQLPPRSTNSIRSPRTHPSSRSNPPSSAAPMTNSAITMSASKPWAEQGKSRRSSPPRNCPSRTVNYRLCPVQSSPAAQYFSRSTAPIHRRAIPPHNCSARRLQAAASLSRPASSSKPVPGSPVTSPPKPQPFKHEHHGLRTAKRGRAALQRPPERFSASLAFTPHSALRIPHSQITYVQPRPPHHHRQSRHRHLERLLLLHQGRHQIRIQTRDLHRRKRH